MIELELFIYFSKSQHYSNINQESKIWGKLEILQDSLIVKIVPYFSFSSSFKYVNMCMLPFLKIGGGKN